MALSQKGRVLYSGGNGPWNLQIDKDGTLIDLRDALDGLDFGKPRWVRRFRRNALKIKLKKLHGKFIEINLTDEGLMQVNQQ